MARMIDKQVMLNLIIDAKRTDPETGSFAEWLAEYLVQHLSTLTQPNEPLTLEVLAKSQLLQMLGEKVEVIRMGEMCQAEWATVRSFGGCKTDSGCLCCHELYGKTWIAYRRPPEGEEEEKHVIEITENL